MNSHKLVIALPLLVLVLATVCSAQPTLNLNPGGVNRPYIFTPTEPTACSPVPTPVETFSATQPEIWVYFAIDNLQVNDVVSIQWRDPSFNVVTPPSGAWSPMTSAGNFCFFDKLNVAGTANASKIGRWWVDVSVNGQQLIFPSPPDAWGFNLAAGGGGGGGGFPNLETIPPIFTNSQPTSCPASPTPISNFAANTPTVWVYFEISGLSAGNQISIRWHDPSGGTARSNSWSPVSSAGTFCFADGLPVAGTSNASRVGRWYVTILLDGQHLIFPSPPDAFGFNLTAAGGGGGGGSCPASGTNLLLNPSFEQPGGVSNYREVGVGDSFIPNWNVTSGAIDYVGAWADSHGQFSLDLNASVRGAVAQTFSTVPNSVYTVCFDLAGNPDGGPTTKSGVVSAAGASSPFSFDATGRSYTSMGWTTVVWTFTATSTQTTLGFASTIDGHMGAAIDNVRVIGQGGGGGGACDISGQWRNELSSGGFTTWTFTHTGGNTYHAVEQGGGNATGTATVTGNTIRLPHTYSGGSNTYEMTLQGCDNATGRVVNPSGQTIAQATWTRISGGGGGGGGAACDISGQWRNQLSSGGTSTWTFTHTGGNTYRAVESGMGNATGTATVTGNAIRLPYTYSGGSGTYQWTLNASCTSATGSVGGTGTTITRISGGGGTGGGGSGNVNVAINQVDQSTCSTNGTNRVIVSVTDSVGMAVTGLTTANFTVRESTQIRTVSVTSLASGGGGGGALSVAFVIDKSSSLSSSDMANMKSAAKSAVSQLPAGAHVAVWSFGSTSNKILDFTSDRAAINHAIDSISVAGSTRMYDTVIEAAQAIAVRAGRKAIILMTDGRDNSSQATLGDTIAQVQLSSAALFPVGFGSVDSSVLQRLASETGGFANLTSSTDLSRILQTLGQVILNQYAITYTSVDVTVEHTIEVTVTWQSFTSTATRRVTVCGGGGGGGGGGSGTDLVSNGTFTPHGGGLTTRTVHAGETIITGWEVTSGSVVLVSSSTWQTAAGTHCVNLGGGTSGSISQSIFTSVGVTYTVTFVTSGDPGVGPPVKTVEVRAGGHRESVTFSTSGWTVTSMGWTTHTVTFTATSSTTNIQFVCTDPLGSSCAAIDNVRVHAGSGAGVSGATLIGIGSITGHAGGSVDVPVSLSGTAPATFQVDLGFDSSRLIFNRARPGSVLTAAGKDLSSNILSAGSLRIVGAGLNQNLIGTGTVALLNFTIGSSFTSGSTTLSCSNARAADAQARGIPASCSPGRITVSSGRCGCDVNGDGVVDVSDAQSIINQVLGVVTPSCDVNGNGSIDIGDVQTDINAVLGKGCN